MNIIDFLKSPCAALPKARPGNVDFPDFLAAIFADYINGLGAISGTDSFTKTILQDIPLVQNIANEVVGSVKDYFFGSPYNAFQRLSLLLRQQSKYFDQLYSIPIDPKYLSGLYRLRKQDTGDFTREQMFHIPFESRHLVSTRRYSIPGFPSLYLGSSTFICWKELGCPQFDNVYSVRLETTGPVRVLDFGYTPRLLTDIIQLLIQPGATNFALYYLTLSKVIFWPLIAASSIRVLHRDEPFKPEYIVPQLVLQFVKDDKTKNIDGIRYFSLHFDQPKDSLSLGCNWVFPVKTSSATGICASLRTMFRMTPVLSWQIAQHIHLPGRSGVTNENIEMVQGYPCSYLDTIFGGNESRSLYMAATPF